MITKSELFWTLSSAETIKNLKTSSAGLTSSEAKSRLTFYGPNILKPKKKFGVFSIFISQFKSPIILILIFAAGLSFFLKDTSDATIILSIVLISSILGFWQEFRATATINKLLETIRIKVNVLRDNQDIEIPLEVIIPGDIIILNAGDILPADCLIIESEDLFVNESTLTGETYPSEKKAGILPPETPISRRTNCLFMGTNVVSGTGKAAVVNTGKSTEFGKISERLKLRPPETEFEHSIKRFGYFLMEITSVLVIVIFAVNIFIKRPFLDSFLFSLALAVGLTPQLLPAIISVNLARGAKRLADLKVVVKHLSSIENFGSMNIFCSDKTGTLTEGIMYLNSATNMNVIKSDKVLFYAYINAFYETGFANPIDETIRVYKGFDLSGYQKLDEIPYDFIRKRLSILVSSEKNNIMITKGAFNNILDVCSLSESENGVLVKIEEVKDKIQKIYKDYASHGLRTLGIAYKNIGKVSSIKREDENELIFLGFLTFEDKPKDGIVETISELKKLGVSLKIITGDNKEVAANISKKIGLQNLKIITGSELYKMIDEALLKIVNEVDVFAEVEPNQKERIIIALKKAGNVVGYMGDGINDASALHAADVSISVNSASDVAKQTADIILLEKDLRVLSKGIKEGRAIFSNTLKYIYMATSANFGNMFSMAGASLFLPFLPLLPKQILLTNLLTDFPEMTIATDNMDKEMVDVPRRFNMKFIRNFMLTFGLISSIFDFATFGILLLVMHATTEQFRTGWFLESVISASVIVLAIRTRRPIFKSKPGKYLLIATFMILAVTLSLPYTPLSTIFGFKPLPFTFILVLAAIVISYIIVVEIAKKIFYKRIRYC
jgi:P-type Mg2+ transporter